MKNTDQRLLVTFKKLERTYAGRKFIPADTFESEIKEYLMKMFGEHPTTEYASIVRKTEYRCQKFIELMEGKYPVAEGFNLVEVRNHIRLWTNLHRYEEAPLANRNNYALSIIKFINERKALKTPELIDSLIPMYKTGGDKSEHVELFKVVNSAGILDKSAIDVMFDRFQFGIVGDIFEGNHQWLLDIPKPDLYNSNFVYTLKNHFSAAIQERSVSCGEFLKRVSESTSPLNALRWVLECYGYALSGRRSSKWLGLDNGFDWVKPFFKTLSEEDYSTFTEGIGWIYEGKQLALLAGLMRSEEDQLAVVNNILNEFNLRAHGKEGFSDILQSAGAKILQSDEMMHGMTDGTVSGLIVLKSLSHNLGLGHKPVEQALEEYAKDEKKMKNAVNIISLIDLEVTLPKFRKEKLNFDLAL